MMKNVLELVPAKARQAVYIAFAAVGLALVATAEGFTAAELSSPVWLNVAQEVYMVLAVGFGVLASGNVNPQQEFDLELE